MAVEQSTLARPYARAAFEFARDTQSLESWWAAMQSGALIASQHDVKTTLAQPAFTAAERASLFLDLKKGVFDSAQENFVHLLAERHRLTLFPEIAKCFSELKLAHEQTTQVQVICKTPLTDAQQQKLSQKLEQQLKQKVTLDQIIDSTALGGLLIKAGDRVIDLSVKSKLKQMADALARA